MAVRTWAISGRYRESKACGVVADRSDGVDEDGRICRPEGSCLPRRLSCPAPVTSLPMCRGIMSRRRFGQPDDHPPLQGEQLGRAGRIEREGHVSPGIAEHPELSGA